MSRQITIKVLSSIFVLLLASISQAQDKTPAKSASQKESPAAVAEFDPKNWKEFSSSEGGFSVLVPTNPVKEEKQLISMIGTVTSVMFVARTNAEYGVSYADYTPEIEGTELLTPFLDSVRDSGVQGIKGQLLDETEISFEGHPGRFYRVEFGGGYLVNVKLLVIKNRLYLVIATTYGKKAPVIVARAYEGFAKKFLDSFKLNPVTTP
ncbi:MAG TPA: hypothetical protein VGO68_02585 [Pyrinomonadaceae bacterium]|jgi:hypothetical protein|nr:hypothetical protein [Pyrinomonadaceae bacterium]